MNNKRIGDWFINPSPFPFGNGKKYTLLDQRRDEQD
jgi:hypothetical protein